MSIKAQYQALLESGGEDAAKRYLEIARSPLHTPAPDSKSGIHCPLCGCPESIVLDSRKRENHIRRRRECSSCHRRISTLEYSEEAIEELKRYRDKLSELVRPATKAHAQLERLIQQLGSVLNED